MIGIDLMVCVGSRWCDEENTSCLLADGMRTCCTASSVQANVLRTQHLRSARVKRKRAQTIQPCLQRAASDVERTVSRSNITNSYQKNIDQSPNTQASETEQLAKTLSPLAQIKAICPKTAKCDAVQKKKNTEAKSELLLEHTCYVKKDFSRIFPSSDLGL